jgi:SAM-dependent MidA family methyltransferase
VDGKHPDIKWHLGFAEIPAKPLLLVANEFFDALPIRQFLHQSDGWMERKISLTPEGQLQFTLEPETPPERLAGEPISSDDYEYSEAATLMTQVLSGRIADCGGCALILDYGYKSGHGNTLQSVQKHQYHDVLAEPGMADITAHVDFHHMVKTAASSGATTYGPVGQGEFLNRLGARERIAILGEKFPAHKDELLTALHRLTSPDQMGELFKAVCFVHPSMPKPDGF